MSLLMRSRPQSPPTGLLKFTCKPALGNLLILFKPGPPKIVTNPRTQIITRYCLNGFSNSCAWSIPHPSSSQLEATFMKILKCKYDWEPMKTMCKYALKIVI
ncbi:hypothetical protein ACTXT7_001848 [Hymenolepis weldensis]